MNIWELPKEHYNWESPITKIYGDIHNEIVRQDEENYMCAIEQAIGYKVDKEELIKALQYDREQYDKGYNDGVKETFTEELEKIKAEIEKIEYYDFDCNLALPAWKVYDIINNYIAEPKGENNPDCRNCDKWKTCENGEKGHANGTSIGYSIGECRDYAELKGETNEAEKHIY